MIRRKRASRRLRGMTLIELTLAMGVAGVVAVATASMLSAVSLASEGADDTRALIARQASLRSRLSAAVRSATHVLHQDGSTLLLWMGDTRQNGTPDLSEMRLLTVDGGTLRCDVPGFDPALDSTQVQVQDAGFTLSDDFSGVPATIQAMTHVQTETWAQGVDTITWSLDNVAATEAKLVSFRVSLSDGQGGKQATQTLIGAGSLRQAW